MKIFKQETDKSCGVACLRSIFYHYGNELTEKEILEKHEFYVTKDGRVQSPAISLGATALKFGFKVKYIGYNPMLVNHSKEDLRESLEKKSKNYYEFGKFCVDKALEFLDLGGKFIVDRLNIEKLKSLADKYGFMIANIRPAFIHKNVSLSFSHMVVIDGYNENSFHVLDPSGNEYYINFDSFLMAFYAIMPEVLIIEKT